MIGRIDLTAGRRPPWLGGVVALLALASLLPPRAMGQAPKAKTKGVTIAPTEPPEPTPAAPAALPDLGQGPPAGPAPEPSAPPAPTPTPDEPRPKVDARVEPAEGEGDKGGLPEAKLPPGGVPPSAGRPSGPEPDPFTIHPDRLSLGKQRVQLSIDVQASPVLNIGKESTVRLVVANESNADASGISVVYLLPDGLKLVSSTPEATAIPADKALFHWNKPMLAAGAEWTIVLKVVAMESKGISEHAATVTAKAGSRANTTVQEPKLKVEATGSPGRLLKGNQVTFTIAVRNPGTGPARNVLIQAKLSGGLRLGGEEVVEQRIPVIKPGERVELDPLIVDTIAGGPQTCTVEVRSADVHQVVVEDHRVVRAVEVTKPDLAVKLTGQDFRFTGQHADYKLAVTNPGTAPARKVKVVVNLPQEGGKLLALPDRATWFKETRKLQWAVDQIEPGQTVEMAFTYLTSTPGFYKATAEATSGELRSIATMATEVSGIAVLDLQIEQPAPVIDVGKTTYYDIKIKNVGSKEATRLQLSGKLTNFKVLKHYGLDSGEFRFNEKTGQFIFPEIERLAVGQSITLSLEVQSTESGPAGCHVFLAHGGTGDEDAKVEDVLSTTVTGNGRPRSAPK